MSKKNEANTNENKASWLKRLGSYAWHTLADDRTELEQDDRDIFQVVADSVLGRTPASKAARSGSAVGAGVAVAGIAKGSMTLFTVGGITFLVCATAEGIRIVRGRNPKDDEDVADAPVIEEPSDVEVVEEVGTKAAAEAESNIHAILKDVAVTTFGWSERKFDQLWSKAKGHEKGGQKLNGKDKAKYTDLVNVAKNLGRIKLAEVPATN